jgi:hypothetical protein
LPEVWLFALGGLFVAVTLLLPYGLIGLLRRREADDMSELISELDAAGMHTPVEPVDATHGILLYLEGVTVSFDGFKAIDNCRCTSAMANCAASSAPTAPAKPR